MLNLLLLLSRLLSKQSNGRQLRVCTTTILVDCICISVNGASKPRHQRIAAVIVALKVFENPKIMVLGHRRIAADIGKCE